MITVSCVEALFERGGLGWTGWGVEVGAVGVWRAVSGYVWRPWLTATVGTKRRTLFTCIARQTRLFWLPEEKKKVKKTDLFSISSQNILRDFHSSLFIGHNRGHTMQTGWIRLHLFSILHMKQRANWSCLCKHQQSEQIREDLYS